MPTAPISTDVPDWSNDSFTLFLPHPLFWFSFCFWRGGQWECVSVCVVCVCVCYRLAFIFKASPATLKTMPATVFHCTPSLVDIPPPGLCWISLGRVEHYAVLPRNGTAPGASRHNDNDIGIYMSAD